jgi:anti-anti-sigma factor
VPRGWDPDKGLPLSSAEPNVSYPHSAPIWEVATTTSTTQLIVATRQRSATAAAPLSDRLYRMTRLEVYCGAACLISIMIGRALNLDRAFPAFLLASMVGGGLFSYFTATPLSQGLLIGVAVGVTPMALLLVAHWIISPRSAEPTAVETGKSVVETNVRETGGIVVLEIAARPDALNWDVLQHQVRELLERDKKSIVIHFAHVTHISSAGLGGLLMARHEVRAKGGDIKLCNVSIHVSHALTITSVAAMLQTFPDERAAIASFENESHA